MLDDLLIGGMAGVISRTATAPLELYKIQRQNQYLKEASIKTVLKKEGVRYLWKGNMTNCLRVFPQIATNFTAFEKSKNHIFNDIEDEKIKNFYSGGVAGVFSMVTIYPLETIRTRLSLQMNKSHYSSPFQAAKQIKFNEMYKGLGISILGFGPFSALNFMFYYQYKDFFDGYDFSPTSTKLLSGGFAGMSALTFTYPTDMLRKHFQMAGFSKDVPRYNGIFDGFRSVVKKDGFFGLYRGLLPSYVRLFPCLAIQFWCLEKGKEIFGKK
jgi:solute carrier family 25 phosphate transporter 23/24/25/41